MRSITTFMINDWNSYNQQDLGVSFDDEKNLF